MKNLRKCVIPAAGLGTRLLPLTKNQPKEMIKVGGRPMIDWVIREALASGLTEICLISSPGKRELESHVIELLNESYQPQIFFCCLEQAEPLGLGRALALAKNFVGDEPFALLLPDNLVRAEVPVIKQMHPCFQKYQLNFNALMEVSSSEQAKGFSNSGRGDLELLEGSVFKVKRIYAKAKGQFRWRKGRRNFRLYPRAILLPEFFSYLNKLCPPFPQEFDDVPIFQKLAADERCLAYLTQARVFDLGNKEGLRRALFYLQKGE